MKKMHIKKFIFAICLLLTASFGTANTIAYFSSKTEFISYSFNVPKAGIEISEDLNDSVKNNVQIENTGTVDSFVRAAVIVTWQNDKGEIYSEIPVEGIDYSITWNVVDKLGAGDWLENTDGFYYCKTAVPGKVWNTTYSTDVLFTACQPLKKSPADGYFLNVEILSQLFHSYPDSDVEAEWPIDVSDGEIVSFN